MLLTLKKYFSGVLRRNWLMYSLGALSLVVTSTTEVLSPKFVQWVTDLLVTRDVNAVPTWLRAPSIIDTIHLVVGVLLVMMLIAAFGRWSWRHTLARRTHYSGRDMKLSMWDALRFQPLQTFHRYTLGDLMNRATGDWNAARFIHGFTMVITCDLIFITILAVTSMVLIDPLLTLYCLLVVPLLPRFVVKLAVKEADQHVVAQEKLSDLSELIAQCLGTIRMQRATGSERPWQERMSKEAEQYARLRYAAIKTGWNIFPLGAAPTLIAYGILLTLGLWRIQAGILTIGEFVALLSYVLMMQTPLFELGTCISEWQKGFASLRRIIEIFNLGAAVKKDGATLVGAASALENDAPAIVLRDVNFTYPGRDTAIFRGVELDIEPGSRLGILGAIGSGKSSLLNALAGLLPIAPDQVFVHGQDVAKVSRKWLATKVLQVPQRTFLFAGTIRDNLLLNDQYDDERLWQVLNVVGMEREVKSFQGALDAVIGEWGINLSGGQKQRLALARALLRVKPIMLFDDCLSAVDAGTEERILDRVSGILSNSTVVWVAHRTSTLRLCTTIMQMDHGRLSLASMNQVRNAERDQVT